MYNKIILVGNLTRDIDMKFSQAGMAIAKSAIATSRKFKSNTGEQKEEVCFVDITFFGRSAEVANQFLRKGSKILVEGRLVFEQWSDQNGQKRSKHGVTVDVMQMLDSKGTTYPESSTSKSIQQDTQYPQKQNTPIEKYPIQTRTPETYTQTSKPSDIPPIDLDEEDIPF